MPQPEFASRDGDDELGWDDAEEKSFDLLRAGIVDVIGRPNFEDPDDGTLRRGAVHVGRSHWSDDDQERYEIEITTWERADHDPERDHFVDDDLADPRIMFFITGPGWSLTAKHGPPDAEIPDDLAEQILDVFRDGTLKFHRGIPRAEWIQPRFTKADDIIQAALDSPFGFEVEFVGGAPECGESYLHEVVEDGLYRSVRLTLVGDAITFFGQILIEDHHAAEVGGFARGYLETEDEALLVIGDGWVVEVSDMDVADSAWMDEHAPRMVAAQNLATALGAQRLESGSTAPGRHWVERFDDGATRFGPQTEEMTKLIGAAAGIQPAFAPEPFTDERERAWKRVETALVRAGRRAELDRALDAIGAVERRDFAKHEGKAAAAGLIARDLIAAHRVRQDDYDALTVPWRGTAGPIHPDDPPVARWDSTDV